MAGRWLPTWCSPTRAVRPGVPGSTRRRCAGASSRTERSGVRGPLVVDPGLLLAGQLLDLGHHPIGDLTPRATRGHAVVLPAHVDRLPEGDGDLDQPQAPGADRLHLGGALQP